MKRRTVLLIALAALAVGYLVRGVRQPKARVTPPDTVSSEQERAAARNAAGEAVPADVPRPRAPRPRFGTPPDQPRYVLLGHAEFARWYRAHAPGLGLPDVADDWVLAGFAAHVVDPLGRIPRPQILRVLLAEYLPWAGSVNGIEAKRISSNRAPNPELDAQEAAATRAFFDNLYRLVAYSDLLLLAHSHRWEFKDVPEPPTSERPPGGKPYAGPVPRAIVKLERQLAPWYLAYRFELDLPLRDAEFLAEFQWGVVRWLGRVPPPAPLRDLVEAYTPLHQRWNQRTAADRDQAVRVFFAALRRRLKKTDYALLAGSLMWKDDCERLGIPQD